MNKGKTIFSQIMSLIPEREFKTCIERYRGNYRTREFTCRDQFLVMSYAQLTNRDSLRDIENCLTALSSKLYHCGISYAVPRNTLAKANEKRDWRIYSDFAQVLLKKVRPLYATDYFRLELDNMVYAFDSSTISLCLKLCPWAKFRKEKGGIKMHTLLDLRGNLPVSVYLTEAAVHDVKALDNLYIENEAIYLMDKGYIDFYRLFNLIHKKNAFFVTRAKENMLFETVSTVTVDQTTGVIADERIKLTGVRTSSWYPEELRMITYEDYSTNNVYRFLTNNFEYEPLMISELYRERWSVELFFKWIKQHLHIKSFYGTSENAIYTQIWIAVCTYLLLAYAKKKMHINQSLHIISKNVGLFLTDKNPLNELFNKTVPSEEQPKDSFGSLFEPDDF
ncbi:IS4 family transposase [Bacteroides pyogenes]|uniref:IS4 family transposase n=1 Tax=Bacteroides pyogenes TaxID=310300 RepID=UPI001BA4A9A9|nr:IS4 family transposase [Bacteroides pyogenes]MBR8707190.1 IS4 family transposase ISDpr1 [Bacteroides pyogenes]MDY5433223.1 IS4 family transposase [Bacteroides pyogenes]